MRPPPVSSTSTSEVWAVSSGHVTVHAGAGNDTFHVGNGYLANQQVDIGLDGGTGGGDSVEFDDHLETLDTFGYGLSNNRFGGSAIGEARHHFRASGFTLDASHDDNIISVGTGVTGFTSIALTGGEGRDSFNITPNTTAEFLLDGGASGGLNDGLNLTANGALRGVFSPGRSGAGQYTFSNRHPIIFAGLESFPQPTNVNGSAPDLVAADDSGRSSTDNVTKVITPSFSGTLAPAGFEIVLYRDGVERGSAIAGSDGSWTIASSAFPTADATYAMTAQFQLTTTGLLSLPGPHSSVRVDAIEPAAPHGP